MSNINTLVQEAVEDVIFTGNAPDERAKYVPSFVKRVNSIKAKPKAINHALMKTLQPECREVSGGEFRCSDKGYELESDKLAHRGGRL